MAIGGVELFQHVGLRCDVTFELAPHPDKIGNIPGYADEAGSSWIFHDLEDAALAIHDKSTRLPLL